MTTQDTINQIKASMEEACDMAALDDYLDDDIASLGGQVYVVSWMDKDGTIWVEGVPFHGKIR